MTDLFLLLIPVPFLLYMALVYKPNPTFSHAVLDNGDHLLIWIGGAQEKIMLHDIKGIKYSRGYQFRYALSYGIAVESVTVDLHAPRHFGSTFSFITPDDGWRWMTPGSESPFTSDLRKRVHIAQAQKRHNLT